jgi:hypothetical protein
MKNTTRQSATTAHDVSPARTAPPAPRRGTLRLRTGLKAGGIFIID